MPTNAAGIFKQLAYKAEATYGVAPGQASGQSLRRITSDISLNKDSYQSQEIVTHQQLSDMRHGVRRVAGSINGELSPGTYKDFFAAILRRDFAAIAASTGMSITISGSGPTYTVARAAGSWLTDGYKVGMVGRLSAGTFNVANAAKNLLIVGVTALNLTVMTLNGSALVAEGPIASSTFTATGKATYIPSTGHTDKSFAIEHWFSDIGQSELFLGCKPTQCQIGLPPTGIATCNWSIAGQDFADTVAKRVGGAALTSQYFTTPTAPTSSSPLAAVNGVVRIGGTTLAIITNADLTIAATYTGDPVVGSNMVPFQFPGRVLVTGNASMYFQDAAARDAFVNETEIDILLAFTSANSDAADFITFTLPRCKYSGGSKDDGEKAIVQTLPFSALYNAAGGSGVQTQQSTIQIQDSQA